MDLLEAIKNRKSIRKFTDESIKKEDLEEIIEVARRAPSSVNGQQISLVYTTDKNIIEKIAHLSGGQAQIRDCSCFITLIGDYYRDKVYLESVGKELTDDIQRLREVAMVDAGIMALTINYVAMAKGYGCTIIGGVKDNPEQIAELLNLPENTIVALGITIGEPTKESLEGTLKPRIKKEAFAMEDKYNKEVQVNAVKDYEKVLDKWFKDINVEQPLFGDVISRFYSK